MKKGCGEGGGEDRGTADLRFGGFGLEGEEGKSEEQAKHERGKERVKIGAVESEIGGGAEVGADEVGIGDHACEDDSECGGAGEAREGGTLEGVGGQGVGEGIHGEKLSHKSSCK